MTPEGTELEFRSVFGAYPDKWAKVQEEEDLLVSSPR